MFSQKAVLECADKSEIYLEELNKNATWEIG